MTLNSEILWQDKPWITPQIMARTALIIVVGALISLIEFTLNFALQPILGVPIIIWTVVIFIFIWMISLFGLLLLRVSNIYTLRKDGLEIKTGLIGTKSFILTAAGYSELEVTRSALQRILNTGNIIVRTESEHEAEMKSIRDPLRVSSILKDVLSRPIFKYDKDLKTK